MALNNPHLNIIKIKYIKRQIIILLFILNGIFILQDSIAAEIDSVSPRILKLDNRVTMVLSIFLCEIQFGQFFKEWQVLGNISYGL